MNKSRRAFSTINTLVKSFDECTTDRDVAGYIQNKFHNTELQQCHVGDYSERVFRVVDEKKHIAGYYTLKAAIDVTCRLCDKTYSNRLFAIAKEKGVSACPVLYHHMMNPYSRDGDLEKVVLLIKEMMAICEGATMGPKTYFMLLRVLAKNGKIAECLEVMKQMSAENVKVDKKMTDIVVAGCTTHKELHAVRQGSFGKRFFNMALLRAYIKMGDLQNAERAVSYIRLHQPEDASRTMWHHLMAGYAKTGNVKDTRRTWQRMTYSKLAATHTTYVHLISACYHAAQHKDDMYITQAEQAFNAACANGHSRVASLWETLLKCYEKVNDFVKFYTLLDVCPPPTAQRFTYDMRNLITLHQNKNRKRLRIQKMQKGVKANAA